MWFPLHVAGSNIFRSSMSLLTFLFINCSEKIDKISKFMELSISPFNSVSTSCVHFESLITYIHIYDHYPSSCVDSFIKMNYPSLSVIILFVLHVSFLGSL